MSTTVFLRKVISNNESDHKSNTDHYIFINIPRLLTEVHPYFHQLFIIQLIRNQITFAINLLQGFFSCAIQFELKYINSILRLHHSISTTMRTTDFRLYKLPNQGEYYIKEA